MIAVLVPPLHTLMYTHTHTHTNTQALQRLHETERSALAGKQRYMSGLLHNLAKVVVAEPVPVDVWSVLLGSGYAPGVWGGMVCDVRGGVCVMDVLCGGMR